MAFWVPLLSFPFTSVVLCREKSYLEGSLACFNIEGGFLRGRWLLLKGFWALGLG